MYQPNEKIKVPGFYHVKWADVEIKQTVWLQGRSYGKAHAYGPYKVVSKHRRELGNIHGNVFMHIAEDLILPGVKE
jgi:hypothetical protein